MRAARRVREAARGKGSIERRDLASGRLHHRLFCQITRNWRARPLASHDIIIKTISAVTTAAGLTVTAILDTGRYPTGIEVSDQRMAELEARVITRHDFHGAWNYALAPAPRPAPEPAPPPPPPAGLCDPATLNHPALTGLDPQALTSLAAALDLPFRAHREQHLYTRRGRGRQRAEGAGGRPQKIDLIRHVLATRLRQHLAVPVHVIAALLGADRTTISHAISLTAKLLGSQLPPAAMPPSTRLRTLDDLREYAASHGIAIPQAANPQPGTLTHPATP